MTLVPLNYKNFVKNKVKNTINVKYKESDPTTYVYDNYLNTNAILNTEEHDNLTIEELNLPNNNNNALDKISDFFSVANNTEGFMVTESKNYFVFKDSKFSNVNVTNSNLKSFNFRNTHKIERIEQKFLPQNIEIQKKNYIKNSLYKEYQKNYSLDYYNNLEYGFCNWNSINFFSQRYQADKNHSNAIVWPNPKIKNNGSNVYNRNTYNFIENSFNLSFYLNLRKNYNDSANPECVFHVPDLISIYIIRAYNSDTDHKIGVCIGNNSKQKLVNITNYNSNTNSSQLLASNSVYVSSELNILNNRWYNLSLNFSKNESNSRGVSLYIDGELKFEVEMTIANDVSSLVNSYISLGNKPDYDINNFNYEHCFYQMFARIFDKDTSLGKNSNWLAIGNELLDVLDPNYYGNISFNGNSLTNSESFHGEIHDIRIYNDVLEEEKIIFNSKNVIFSLENEIREYSLQFYVPVHYIPSYTHKKESFNASSDKINLRYSCIYNPVFANTCGGLNVSAESYLIDLVNHTKPNVIIGGNEPLYVYNDNLTNSTSQLVDNALDVLDIKKGVLTQTIYNKNLEDGTHQNRSINLDSNLSYRNLLILPNDNGIQNVRFDIIKEFLENYNEASYDSSQVNNNKLYNIEIENIFSKDYLNRSWRSFNVDLVDNIPDLVTNATSKLIIVNGKEETFENRVSGRDLDADVLFTVSNIIFHDSRLTNIENASTEIVNSDSFNLLKRNHTNIFNKIIEKYDITKSNPVLREYKQDINNTAINNTHLNTTVSLEYKEEDINYLKLPVPYSVFNVDYDSLFTTIFDISSKLYNTKIKKNTFLLKDTALETTNININISLSDNSKGGLYRNNCLTKVAEWNYVGHVFYNDGIVSLNRPELSAYFGKNDFECEFESDFMTYVHEINIPANKGLFDISSNSSYDKDLRQDESAFNSEESFVYITDINLHDENLNVVARARLARPAPKKKSDSILFRLKMDY